MGIKKGTKLTNRDGASLEMKQRKLRLTEDENEMLDELLETSKMTLRDFIVYLVEEEYKRECM